MNHAQIVWRSVSPSAALEQRIQGEVTALEAAAPRITACRVVIEAPHRHRHGGHFAIKIELVVPGRVLSVTRDPPENTQAEDAYVALGEAFAAMRRQLVEYRQVRRGEVKRHGLGPHAP
jgi:ribosome-associated translation inhibitor RaiA